MTTQKDSTHNNSSSRETLIKRMSELESQGKDCSGCPGTCCTFVSNSMMCTPQEAMDLYLYLEKEKRITVDFIDKLKLSIQKYKLSPRYLSEKSYLRKTYTCPLFSESEKGCTVSRKAKPHGCLAFNNHDPLKKASEGCFSEQHLLEEIKEHEFKNDTLNLGWVKAPIPNAILELYEKRNLISNL